MKIYKGLWENCRPLQKGKVFKMKDSEQILTVLHDKMLRGEVKPNEVLSMIGFYLLKIGDHSLEITSVVHRIHQAVKLLNEWEEIE